MILTVVAVTTALGFLFALMILGDTRKIYRTPWAFGFIALRLLLTLVVRLMKLRFCPIRGCEPYHTAYIYIEAFCSVLDVLSLMSMWLGYGEVFDDTPLRKFIRSHWPFK